MGRVATFTKANYDYKPIDELPFPDYEPFNINDMMDNFSMATRLLYRYSRTNPRPYNIVASRSCPYNCSFCVHDHRSIPYRARSIENIMAEIKESYEKYHFNILLILDELFVVNKKRMRDFCEAILEGKAKYGWDFDWMFQTHANARLDAEQLALAKKAGCFLFSYGLESASPRVLESMNKKLRIEQVIEAMDLATQAKIGFSANLIFGDTAETEETIAESLSFWLKHTRAHFVFLGNLMPYPGSKIFNDIRAKGMFKDKKEYYEKIDQGVPNITAIADKTYAGFLNMLQFLEKSWLFAKVAPVSSVEEENGDAILLRYMGGSFFKIKAKCPYCGEEIYYRERLMDGKTPFFLGTGCVKCGRRIKVTLGGG